MKRSLAIAALLVTLVTGVGFAACSAGGGSGGSAESGNSGPTLRMVGNDPLTLDPALTSDAASAAYVVEIYSGLVTIDKDLKLAPDIASSWDVSADGKTYTFHLRHDVAFQGTGRQVTANDFKYSMERAASPDTASTTAESYLGDIVGAKDMIDGTTDQISGIEVVDDYTLKITIDAPKPYFLAKMSCPAAFVVDRTQIEADERNWSRKPHGTGPFMVKDWKLGESLTLQANEQYYGGAPSLKTINFILSGGSQLTMYEDDEVDVAGVGIADVERAEDPSDALHSEYRSVDQMAIHYLGFNTQKAPFDDPKVREAFAMAIDRDKIAEVVLKGIVPVAQSILPPGIPGYNANSTVPAYDPAKAKQLLGESKYGTSGVGTIILSQVGGGASAGDDAQAMVQMWKDNLGIDVQIQQTDQATFWQDLDKRSYQLFTAGWVVDYPDPENVLDLLFNSKSQQNTSGYNNPQVDQLLAQAGTEQDPAARMAEYQQIEQLILADLPVMPLYYGRDHYVVKPYVQNMISAPLVMPYLRYVTIAQ
jgi:oligopeptide transport system substrate-binding protein